MRVEATPKKTATTPSNTKTIAIIGVCVLAVVGIIVALIVSSGNKSEDVQVIDTAQVQQLTKATYSKKKIEYSDDDFAKDKAIIDAAYEKAQQEAKEQSEQNQSASESTDASTESSGESGDNGGTTANLASNTDDDYTYVPPQINIDDMSDSYKEMEKKNDEVINKAKEEVTDGMDDESKDEISKEMENLDTQQLISDFLTQNNASLKYVKNKFGFVGNIYTQDEYDDYIAKVANYLKTGETFSNQYTEQVPIEAGAAYLKSYTSSVLLTNYKPVSWSGIVTTYSSSTSSLTCDEYTNWFKIQPEIQKVYSISVDSSDTATVTTESGKYKITFSIITSTNSGYASQDTGSFHIKDVEKVN